MALMNCKDRCRLYGIVFHDIVFSCMSRNGPNSTTLLVRPKVYSCIPVKLIDATKNFQYYQKVFVTT